jgi:hypothetical protein
MTTPLALTPESVANCRLDAGNDSRFVRCITIQHGTDIIASEDQGRLGRTFYPNHTDQTQFSIELVFVHWEEYNDLGVWLKSYMSDVLSEKASAMRVRCDLREFDRLGVLAGGVSFGDHVGAVTYGMALTFLGARDAITIKSPAVSSFGGSASTDYDQYGRYFYPAGTQLGADNAAAQFYDDVPSGVNVPGGTTPQDLNGIHQILGIDPALTLLAPNPNPIDTQPIGLGLRG